MHWRVDRLVSVHFVASSKALWYASLNCHYLYRKYMMVYRPLPTNKVIPKEEESSSTIITPTAFQKTTSRMVDFQFIFYFKANFFEEVTSKVAHHVDIRTICMTRDGRWSTPLSSSAVSAITAASSSFTLVIAFVSMVVCRNGRC